MSIRTGLSSGFHGRPGGFTLIELIMFIIIVGVGLAGIVSVFNVVTSRSADPMIRKQLLSIAEALLEEVALQPFTYCDPTDPAWSSATAASSAGGCAIVEGLGAAAEQWSPTGPPYGNQARVSAATPFNNVSDYNGLALGSPITDISGSLTTAPAGYSATIAVVPESLGGIVSADCAAADNCTAMNVVRIAITVTRGGDSLTLEGYRARYWPNDEPW